MSMPDTSNGWSTEMNGYGGDVWGDSGFFEGALSDEDGNELETFSDNTAEAVIAQIEEARRRLG